MPSSVTTLDFTKDGNRTFVVVGYDTLGNEPFDTNVPATEGLTLDTIDPSMSEMKYVLWSVDSCMHGMNDLKSSMHISFDARPTLFNTVDGVPTVPAFVIVFSFTYWVVDEEPCTSYAT